MGVLGVVLSLVCGLTDFAGSSLAQSATLVGSTANTGERQALATRIRVVAVARVEAFQIFSSPTRGAATKTS